MLSPGGFNSPPTAPSPGTSIGTLHVSGSAAASPLPSHLGSLDYLSVVQQQQQQQQPQYGTACIPVASTKDAPATPKGGERPPPLPRPPPAIALSLTLQRLESTSRQIAAIRSGAEALIEAVDHVSRLGRSSSSSSVVSSQAPPAITSSFPPPPSSLSSVSSDQLGGGSSFRGRIASPPGPSFASQGTFAGVGGLRSSPGPAAGAATPQGPSIGSIPAAPAAAGPASSSKPGAIVLSVAEIVRKAINNLRVTGKELLAALAVDSGASSTPRGFRGSTAGSRVPAVDPPNTPTTFASLRGAPPPPLPPPPPCPDGSRLLFEWSRYLEGHAVATAIERAKAASIAFEEQCGEWRRGRGRNISLYVLEGAGLNPLSRQTAAAGKRRRRAEGDDLLVILQRVTATCPNMKLTLSSRLAWGRHVYPPVAVAYGGGWSDGNEENAGRTGGGGRGGVIQQQMQVQVPPEYQTVSIRQEEGMEPTVGSLGRGGGMEDHSVGLGEEVNGGQVMGEEDRLEGGQPAVIHVSCQGVFQAVIALGPFLRPLAISVFAPDEVVGVHAWGLSTRHVFSLLTAHVIRALHCFNDEEGGDDEEEEEDDKENKQKKEMGGAGDVAEAGGGGGGLERLLKWLYGYRSLFSEPCAVCKKILAHDPPTRALLPPILHSFGSEKRREEKEQKKTKKRREEKQRQRVQKVLRSTQLGLTSPSSSTAAAVAVAGGGGGTGSGGEMRVGRGGGVDDGLGRVLAGIAASGHRQPQQERSGSFTRNSSHHGGYDGGEDSLAYHINCVLKK